MRSVHMQKQWSLWEQLHLRILAYCVSAIGTLLHCHINISSNFTLLYLASFWLLTVSYLIAGQSDEDLGTRLAVGIWALGRRENCLTLSWIQWDRYSWEHAGGCNHCCKRGEKTVRPTFSFHILYIPCYAHQCARACVFVIQWLLPTPDLAVY